MPKIYNRGRYKMKKIISLFLAAVMIFSVSSVSFAAADECDCGVTPVVYVQGFGEALYENVDTEDEISAFPPETPAILKAIVPIALSNTKTYPDQAQALSEINLLRSSFVSVSIFSRYSGSLRNFTN